jgi:hypothetical protein
MLIKTKIGSCKVISSSFLNQGVLHMDTVDVMEGLEMGSAALASRNSRRRRSW